MRFEAADERLLAAYRQEIEGALETAKAHA